MIPLNRKHFHVFFTFFYFALPVLTVYEPYGQVSPYAGETFTIGFTDGYRTDALFFQPRGLAVSRSGDLFVADSWNRAIRRITAGGQVSLYTGSPSVSGGTDGNLSSAGFSFPTGLVFDSMDNMIISDNNSLRKITPEGMVSTLPLTGNSTLEDLAVGPDGTVYFVDITNFKIRSINTTTGTVQTLAGSGKRGTTDGMGTAADFDYPTGITYNRISGKLYVTEEKTNTIRCITLAGMVTTLAGNSSATNASTDGTGTAARFNGPFRIVSNLAGDMIVSEVSVLRKVTVDGIVTTLAASFEDGPMGLALDANQNLFVTDRNSIKLVMYGKFEAFFLFRFFFWRNIY